MRKPSHLQPIRIDPLHLAGMLLAVAATASGAALAFAAKPHSPWAMVCIAIVITSAFLLGFLTAHSTQGQRAHTIEATNRQVAESAADIADVLRSNRTLADDFRCFTATLSASSGGSDRPASGSRRTGDTGGNRIYNSR